METKTELHTHLMGMLSPKRFIEFLASLDYKFPLDYSGELNFEYSNVDRIDAIKLLDNPNIMRQISIRHGDKIAYSMLNSYYLNRTTLLADLIEQIAVSRNLTDNKEMIKYFVYGKYMEECLKELISQGVEYVEISFSNARIIENSFNLIDPKVLDKIKCKFLLSTDRAGVSKDFKQSSRYMANLIEKDLSVGFDMMGTELPLSELDMDRTSKFGLEQKLTPVIEKLNKWENTTLRVHSGETRYSGANTQKILTVIERIEKELNIIIPPPQIRIGHGVYFNKSAEYLRLLKKFNCIIEVNASSNYALDNINDYKDIPYNYYLDKGIEVVICSDGHGMYDTTKGIEDNIADENVSETNKKKIVDFDEKLRKVK